MSAKKKKHMVRKKTFWVDSKAIRKYAMDVVSKKYLFVWDVFPTALATW